MSLRDALDPGRVALGVEVRSKKSALEALANLFAAKVPGLSATGVFDALIAREKLGSTGLGYGVAIPHGRVRGVQEALAAVLTSATPIDFDAVDGEPVDVFIALLVPEEATQTHLSLLAALASQLDQASLRTALRTACDTAYACELLGGDVQA